MLDTKVKEALDKLGSNPDALAYLQEVLDSAASREKALEEQQVAYKADEPTVELPDLVINGVTYKAFPPKADEPAAAAAVVEEDATLEMPMEEEVVDENALTLSAGDLAAIQGMIAQVMGALELEKKVAGHVQGLMAPYTAQKDSEQAERDEKIANLQTALKTAQDQIAPIQAQLNELLGLQPEVSPRASASPASALNPFNPADNALLAAVKDQVPIDQQQFVNGFEDLKIKLFGA